MFGYVKKDKVKEEVLYLVRLYATSESNIAEIYASVSRESEKIDKNSVVHKFNIKRLNESIYANHQLVDLHNELRKLLDRM